MGCIYTYCTAMNDLSLNRISKDNEKFDRWVKWVGNEIRVKFCLSENEMCVWNFGRAHGLKNRKSNASFLTNTFICNFTCVKVSKEIIHTCTTKRCLNLQVQDALDILNSYEVLSQLRNDIRIYLCTKQLKRIGMPTSPLLFIFEASYISSQMREKYIRQI